jgi:hypothetical protein
MAAVPPLVQLAHRGPQEAAVGVKLTLPFAEKPKVTKEQKYRDAVKELRTLGMPQAACDGLLDLINQDSDDALSTDADCFQTMACIPPNARGLLLDAFWKEDYRFNRGNAERSRGDLKNLSSKLMALATAADNWWSVLKTDHLANVVVDPVQRVQIRETLRAWSSVALELVKVLDATIDLASAETRLEQHRNDLTTAEQVQKSRTHALEGVKEAHGRNIAELEDVITTYKTYISDATASMEDREMMLRSLRRDIATHEESLREATRAAIRAEREKTVAAETAQKKMKEEGVAKKVYLQLALPSLDPKPRSGAPAAAAAAADSAGNAGGSNGGDDSGSGEFSVEATGDAARTGARLHDKVQAAAQKL